MPSPADEWIEVNLVAPDERDPESLLLGVVEPIVHRRMAREIERWFYFWEPELRLRLRWREPARADENRAALAELLEHARADRTLARWWEGNHGKEGERYRGEADFYGAELWDLTSRDWMAGSELALAIVELDSAGRLGKPRGFHWRRRLHLFSNQLLLDEMSHCLRYVSGYIDQRRPDDPRLDEVRRAIEKFLAE